MLIERRSFLIGLFAAPIIVRAGILMPIRPIESTKLILAPGDYFAEVFDVIHSAEGRLELIYKVIPQAKKARSFPSYPTKEQLDAEMYGKIDASSGFRVGDILKIEGAS